MDAARKRALANDWLKDLCLALKNVEQYSAEHARGREYVDRAFDSLIALLADRRECTLSRTDGRLFVDQIILDRDRELAHALAGELSARGIDHLVFHASLTPQEHLGFIRCLLAKPERIAEKGGIGQLLKEEQVASISPAIELRAPARETGAVPRLGELELIDFMARLSRGPGGSFVPGTFPASLPSATSLLERDPAELTRAIMAAARQREGEGDAGPDTLAEIIADTLERFAEKALEEHQTSREDILAAIGSAAVAADPETHHPLFLEKAGPRSIRKNLAAAVEGLPAEAVADLVAAHYQGDATDYRRLTDILGRLTVWKDDRSASLTGLEARLDALGVTGNAYRRVVDLLLWSDLSLARRLEILYSGDYLWRVDFTRLKDVLVKQLSGDQLKEASALVQKYLSGLLSDDSETRRRVADNSRHILQLIEKTPKGQPILNRIADLFFTRLQEEKDPEVVPRLSGGLAFLADLRLRSGELGPALDLMRKAEQLGSSPIAPLKERGEKLAEALARAGNDKIFRTLTGMLLDGSDHSSMEAAEILKRGGARSAGYLIERLAEEENRSHRARLVMLLKEMGKGSSRPFVDRLDDPRWFLVRNVVGILGDIGEVNVLPHLRKVTSHQDPRVRREVVRTFMRFATPECEELIIAALGDDDRGVQITAVSALATFKGPRATGVLSEVARKTGSFQSASTEVRQEALIQLGKMGAREVGPIASQILTRKGFLGHAEPVDMRVAAVKALAALGTGEARKILKDLAQNDPRQQVRDAAQEGLQQRTASAGTAANHPR